MFGKNRIYLAMYQCFFFLVCASDDLISPHTLVIHAPKSQKVHSVVTLDEVSKRIIPEAPKTNVFSISCLLCVHVCMFTSGYLVLPAVIHAPENQNVRSVPLTK